MSSPVAPEIIARLSLFPTEAGGRGLPPRQGDWRTILTVGSESFSARVAARVGHLLEPGATSEAEVQFLFPDAALPRFKPGIQFKIWEGTDVGTGEVLSIVSTSNKSLERTRER
jgi:hypothetical protein